MPRRERRDSDDGRKKGGEPALLSNGKGARNIKGRGRRGRNITLGKGRRGYQKSDFRIGLFETSKKGKK